MKTIALLGMLLFVLAGAYGQDLQKSADAECAKLLGYGWVAVGVDAQTPHGTACRMSAQNAPSTSKSPDLDIPAIAREANGSVVSIVMSDKDGHPLAQGSGFLISKDGHVVTNYHVIRNGSSAVIKLPDGAFFAVDGVIASDKTRDVAIIKAHGNNFRSLTLGDSDRLQVGQQVIAIGSPLSLESTVSNGIISGIRTVEEEGGKFVQITVPISPGSSGGPLFNMAGKVVGITTAGLRGGENLNFAIPINDVKPLLLDRSSRALALPDEAEDDVSGKHNGPSTKIKPDESSGNTTKADVPSRNARPTFQAETNSAVVWGDNSNSKWWSGFRTDPVTGNKTKTLFFEPAAPTDRTVAVEVRFAAQIPGPDKRGVIVANFTFINNTDTPLTVHGSTFQSTEPLLTPKALKKAVKGDATDFYNRMNVTVLPGQSGSLWFPAHYDYTHWLFGSDGAFYLQRPNLSAPRFAIHVSGYDCVFTLPVPAICSGIVCTQPQE